MRVRNKHILRGHLAADERSYREIADAAGVHHSHLANIATGRRGCTPDVAHRICQTLGLDTAVLFTDVIADDTSSIVA